MDQNQKERVVPITPVKKGQYKNTAEMIRDLSRDEVSAERSIREMRQRCLIDHLMAQRALLELSQADMAKKMGCSQGRISKLENGDDDDLRIGDFREYAKALGLDLGFLLSKRDVTIVEQVKQHVFAMGRLLNRLVNLAGDDESMANGTEKFFREVVLNSVRVVVEASERLAGNLDSANKNGLLANIPNEPPPPLQVACSVQGEMCSQNNPCESRKRQRTST